MCRLVTAIAFRHLRAPWARDDGWRCCSYFPKTKPNFPTKPNQNAKQNTPPKNNNNQQQSENEGKIRYF
jgi:hypothetical protein